MNPITTILFLGAAQGMMLAIILLSIRRGNRTANRILATILILFSLNIALHTLEHSTYLSLLPYHSNIIALLFFLFGPLVYFYVMALTLPFSGSRFRFGKKEFLHLIPFGTCAILFMPFYIQALHTGTERLPLIMRVVLGLLIIHVLTYIILVIQKLRIHARDIKASFSSIERINLNWLRFLITTMTIFWFAAFLLESLGDRSDLWDYLWLLVSIFMYSIGYFGMRQPEIFSGTNNTLPKKKYEKSTLTTEKAAEYLEQLLQLMDKEKPFLESDLTLPGLAGKLSITPHDLSRIINEQLNQNFFEFVNQYRVEEAKKMIIDPGNKNLKMAAIGFNVGFNSTSAFNTAFKKHTRMTPSQFRKAASPLPDL